MQAAADLANAFFHSGYSDAYQASGTDGDFSEPPKDENVILPLFVANGVTGVRDMGGDLETLRSWRSQVAAGKLLGPRLVIAGPMLDGPVPRFPSSAPVKDAA